MIHMGGVEREGVEGNFTLFICFRFAFCFSNSCLVALRASCDERDRLGDTRLQVKGSSKSDLKYSIIQDIKINM